MREKEGGGLDWTLKSEIVTRERCGEGGMVTFVNLEGSVVLPAVY